MPSSVTATGVTSEADAVRELRQGGMTPRAWSNAPGDTYSAHEHRYEKHLYCVSGEITFHTPEADLTLRPGDLLRLPPGTVHSASVGAEGVRCVEGSRSL